MESICRSTTSAAFAPRPFVKTNKTDAADAQAIWEAAQRPEMRFVALKTEEQQAVLSLHRIRQQLVKVRTMQALQIRSLLYEFGIVLPKSWRALLQQAGPVLARAVITQGSRPGRTLEPWIQALLLRRPKNVAIVALANKMARTAWALLAHGRTFDRSWSEALPAPAV